MKEYDGGFVLAKGDKYVTDVILNQHSERPVVCWDKNIMQALTYKTRDAAEERAKHLDCTVLECTLIYDGQRWKKIPKEASEDAG